MKIVKVTIRIENMFIWDNYLFISIWIGIYHPTFIRFQIILYLCRYKLVIHKEH